MSENRNVRNRRVRAEAMLHAVIEFVLSNDGNTANDVALGMGKPVGDVRVALTAAGKMGLLGLFAKPWEPGLWMDAKTAAHMRKDFAAEVKARQAAVRLDEYRRKKSGAQNRKGEFTERELDAWMAAKPSQNLVTLDESWRAEDVPAINSVWALAKINS